ncbi:prolipoprotein diacylglyceryl transferase [Leekyejoonella antrihumi]|uniref:Phosphatidylglycerol--prolipoprotein diacylglyceryl transferase n=1 Tax=Leekyejoonella antrihumi TaxID=1660198 RepID=A0A563E1F0_9MICO|nr:prolipoprotein diacylglyceryl transferase [Leekyejoonella antrihumi]TWP36063.1 prolipoprotein diacylglyceryl transferase [Leekyejoonella antrihumi]
MNAVWQWATRRAQPRPEPRTAAGWLRGSRLGLLCAAALVGVGAGFGAVAFRYLIFAFTWLATGRTNFGQQGRVDSSHLPWLGPAFFVLVPVVGGLLYGPLIYRFAREARGHGVPEVMIAVAENGGRIRPQVSGVKAVASALCIGVGGSVGREGPIVQIGSALASSLGQWVRMPENRLRVLVACGAAGGISATFNAPITGVLFGVELILREFSIDAIFTVMLSAMLADVISRVFFGSAAFLTGFPHDLVIGHSYDYVLVAGLAVIAALLGLAFTKVLYATEDLCDRTWGQRPEWARPAVGGILLGLLLLAVPQLYGVGYPVMFHAAAGNYALWFLVVLALGKMLACSVTIGIGGSGGVFAPSLFIGATAGMAFGDVAGHLFGPAAGSPVIYAIVGMAAVFAAAARGPLTALASVVEMTGDFTLTLPVMLAAAISTTISRALSHGTIYTTKLIRRGTDIDRTTAGHAFDALSVADAMHPFPAPVPADRHPGSREPTSSAVSGLPPDARLYRLLGAVTRIREPQALFSDDSLAQVLRQLVRYGRDGLPVLSTDGHQLQGWVTNQNVLRAVSAGLFAAEPTAERRTAEWADPHPQGPDRDPGTRRSGYRIVEYTLTEDTVAVGGRLEAIDWPPGYLPVSVLHSRRLVDPDPSLRLLPGGPDQRPDSDAQRGALDRAVRRRRPGGLGPAEPRRRGAVDDGLIMIPGSFAMSIPSPPTNGIHVGPIELHFYGLMYVVGIAAAIWLARRRWQAAGGDPSLIDEIAIWSVPAGIVGGRIYFDITTPAVMPHHWWGPFAVWDGGLGIWGGIALAAVVGLWRVHRRGAGMGLVMDAVAPSLLLAQGIGRIGNYFNQELFGGPTSLPWALQIAPRFRPPGYAQYPTFHPTFLYELIFDLAWAGFLIWLGRTGRFRPPSLFALYVAGYSAFRIFEESLRIDYSQHILGLRLNTFVASGLALIGIGWFLWLLRKPRPAA